MKRIVSLITLVTILMCTTSCAALGGGSSIPEEPEKEEYVTITVKTEEQDYTYEIPVGKTAKIELPIKSNSMCTGIYSEPEGDGTKYFDSEGDSTMKWQSNFPDVLYAHFESIIGLKYISETSFEEDPKYISYYKGYLFTFDMSDEFIAALNTNTSAKVKITVYYDIIGAATHYNKVIAYISSTNDSEGELVNDSFDSVFSSFSQKKLSTTCSAKQILKEGKVYFHCSAKYGYEDYRIKNVYCTIEILGE